MDRGNMQAGEAEEEYEIVITGMAGKFPGSNNIDELRDNLFNKVNLVTEEHCNWKSNNKWNVPSATGNIQDHTRFDHAQFGIHHKQVLSLDPMTRLIMERSFEAVCDSGFSLAELKGSNTGVYMSSTHGEGEMMFDHEVYGDGFGVLGQNRSMLATRVSYFLDLSGPSYVAETSWCGGVTVLTEAFRDIKAGRCEAAIVGAPSLTLFPEMSWHMMQCGMLSPDAKCKSFDDAADGYGRGEAVVILFLQKSTIAKRVYASVVHADANCFGGRQSFTHIPQNSISELLTNFYNTCHVDPSSVEYLEADGSGIKKNDEAELNAVDSVMLRNRTSPLLIGSVKSNLGHTEAASSFVSIVKVLLAMEAGFIPPNLHYDNPASGVPALTQGRLQVVTEKTAWSGGLAAINSLGMDGYCGHVLLKSFDRKKRPADVTDVVPRLVMISGRTDAGIHKLLTKIKESPFDTEYIRLVQDVHVDSIPGHIYRGFAIAVPGENKVQIVERFSGKKRPIWFVFSGMGSQWPGMGIHLLKLPIFKAAVDKCHAILKPRGVDLLHIITSTDPTIFDKILHCFVGIAAVQIGLLDVMKAMDIVPDGMIGHSVGELGCAYADGCMTSEEMILAAYARGLASQEATLIKGTMAAVGLGFTQIKDMLPPTIEVACHNGPESCTISGPSEDLENFVAHLTSKGIFAKSVNVANIAYHSRYIAPAAPRLIELLNEFIPTPRPRSSRWISTSIPEEKWGSLLAQTSSPEYHTNNLLSSVLFEEGSRHIPNGAVTIEIAPHGLLQAILRRSLGPDCTKIALAQRGKEDGLEFLLTAIGKLYLSGLQPKVSALYPPVRFPVSRGTPVMSSNVDWDHSEDWTTINSLKECLTAGEREVTVNMSHEEVRAYDGNSIDGHIVFPEAGYLKLVWETFASLNKAQLENLPVAFEGVRFHATANIPEKGSLTLYLMVQRGTGEFEVVNKKDTKILAKGRIYIPEILEKEFVTAPVMDEKGTMNLTSDDIYTEFEQRGYQYTGNLRSIVSACTSDTGSVSQILWRNNWVTFIMSMIQQSVLQTGENTQDIQIPSSIQKLVINPTKHLLAGKNNIEVLSHVTTGIILGGGIQIQGLKTKLYSKTSDSNQPELRLDTLKFVPYKNPRLHSVKDFVNICVQIAIENSKTSIQSKSNVTIIEEGNPHSLVPHIEECLSKYPFIEISVKTCDNSDGHISAEPTSGAFLVVVSQKYLQDGLTFLAKSGGFILTRIEYSDSLNCNNNVAIVAEQDFGSGKFLLLRKVDSLHNGIPAVIECKKDEKSWIKYLRASIEEKKGEIILVSEGQPQFGIESFIENLSKEPGSEVIRYVFMLGTDCPKFSLTDNWYAEQLQQKLVVNIYQDKKWGSLRQLPLVEGSCVPTDNIALPLPSLELEGIQLNYLGLNKKDVEGKQCELGHVDFSGRTGMSQWVMGVTKIGSTKPDPYLTWKVPEAWGLDEAATIPHAYATAYYALILTGKLESGQSILIHEGCSSIGQAAIAVALDLGCTVYTTVANQRQHSTLVSKFPKLLPTNIYSSNNCKFEIQIRLATGNEGVTVILNSLPGRRLQATLRCLSKHGNFLQLGRKDQCKNSTIGMLLFNGSKTVYGIATDNLFNACQDWKERLHALVEDGIKTGVVLPLDHRVFLYQQYHRALEMLADDTQWNSVLLNVREANRTSDYLRAEMISRLQFDPKSSFLIIGGKTNQWLDLANWLLQRGARNLIIAQSVNPITNYISRRLDLLQKYSKAVVKMVAEDEAMTSSGANVLVEQANKHGPLAAIFVLPIVGSTTEYQSNGSWLSGSASLTTIQNIDIASRNGHVKHFVCLLCKGAENACEGRRQAGQTGLSIQWDSRQSGNIELRQILGRLDRLLGANIDHPVIFSPVCSYERPTTNSNGKSSLDEFLPHSIEDLLKIGTELSTEPMEEVVSLSPGLQEVKEVPPVFFLSGLGGASNEVLQSITSRLMYPVVCVKMPQGSQSIEEMAKTIAKDVQAVQTFGSYNLVGDLWAGALVLEVAKSLEAQGQKTQVFILEGAPDTSKATIKELGEGPTMDTNLICRLLNISSEKVKEEIDECTTWESKLKHCLNRLPVSSDADTHLIGKAISTIRSHLLALVQYKPNGQQVASLVTLVRPLGEEEHNCGLIKFCKNTVTVNLVGQNHQDMLSSIITSDIIGDRVIL